MIDADLLTRKPYARRVYNDKECWEIAMSWGAAFTYRKLSRWHIEKYGYGSQMGPFWAMWRYACNNPEECFPAYKEWQFLTTENFLRHSREPNKDMTFEDFLKECRNHCKDRKSVLSRTAYKKFCKKYGLDEQGR